MEESSKILRENLPWDLFTGILSWLWKTKHNSEGNEEQTVMETLLSIKYKNQGAFENLHLEILGI